MSDRDVLEARTRALQAKLVTIDPNAVKPDFVDRSVPAKELAAAIRNLFKSLGLKGISVTAPGGWRNDVEIQLPRGGDHDKVNAILYNAFPNCRDQSDTIVDHYDYRWTVS